MVPNRTVLPSGTAAAGALIALAAVCSGAAWRAADGSLPSGDDILHLRASWSTAQEFLSTPLPQKPCLFYFIGYTSGYPPLFYWVFTAFFVIGLDLGAASTAALQVFVLPLAWALYAMGRRLGGRGAGLAALLVGLGGPAATLYARRCYLDFPLLACVAVALACLLASDGFTRRPGSVGFALALAASMLLKWAALLFLLPAAWWAWTLGSSRPWRAGAAAGLGALGGLAVLGGAAWMAAETGPEAGARMALWGVTLSGAALGTRAWVGRDRGRRLNLSLTWLVPLALAGPWYFAFAPPLRRHLEFVFLRRDFDLPLPAHEAGSWVVALAMARDGLLAPAALLAALAALGAVILRPNRDARVLAGGMLLSFLALGAMLFKDVRYLLPLVAFAAPLAAWAPSLLARPWRELAWVVLGVSGLLPLVGWILPWPGARPVTHPDWTKARVLQYSAPPLLGWRPEERPYRRELAGRLEALGAGVVLWPREAGPQAGWLNLEARRRGLSIYFDPDGRFGDPTHALEADPAGDWVLPTGRFRLQDRPGGPLPDPVDLAHAQVPPPLPLWRPDLLAWYLRSDPYSEWAPRGPAPGR